MLLRIKKRGFVMIDEASFVETLMDVKLLLDFSVGPVEPWDECL